MATAFTDPSAQLDFPAFRPEMAFPPLTDAMIETIRAYGSEITEPAGTALYTRGERGTDMFVVLEGSVEVTADGLMLTTCGPGEFFGELAAIDWGAGFGRTRSATVTATTTARLLVLDWMLVNWLNGADATFAEELTRVSQERLARH